MVFLIIMLVDNQVTRNVSTNSTKYEMQGSFGEVLVLNTTRPVALQIVVTWRHGGHTGVQDNKTAAMLMYRKILWGLNFFLQ